MFLIFALILAVLGWPASIAGAENDLTNFSSNLPIVVLQSVRPGAVSTSRDFTPFLIQIHEPEPESSNPARLDRPPTFTSRGGLRLHGMVSRIFPKHSFRLELQDNAGRKRKASLLGMPADADWILQGPWLDKSLIRNAFSYNLARAMGCAAMRTRPCEVFLSTFGRPARAADYIGVYQLTERIERGKDRVNVANLEPNENEEPNITGGYILDWDVGTGNYLSHWKSIQVKYPPAPSRAQKIWIDRAFTRFDQALKGSDFADPVRGYAAHIDVDAWVNYVLFEEFIFNLDGYTRSFYFHKDRGGKIRPGPVWDHDLALGHQFQMGTSFNEWWFNQVGKHGWFTRLMSDPAFRDRAARRWAALRADVLSDAAVDARVDRIAAPLLSGAAERNFRRWPVLNVERPFPKPSDYITIATATYPEQIVALKKFLHRRGAWMDSALRL